MNQNAMQVLDIYRHANCWVFDAPEYELCKEPFVLGSSEIISSHLPRDTMRAKLIFSDEYFPMSSHLDREMSDGGGFWYGLDGVAGWLCPATLHYFEELPETIYFRVEPTQLGNYSQCDGANFDRLLFKTQYEYLMEDILMLLESGDIALDFEHEPAQAQTIRIISDIVKRELETIEDINEMNDWLSNYYADEEE